MSETPDRLPRHVAIIMDGNGRWARRRALPRTEGHLAGVESAREVTRCSVDLGIPFLTLYAFSTENWKRPPEEVRFLMEQLVKFLWREREQFLENEIHVNAVGRVNALPAGARKELRRIAEHTAHCRKLNLNLALNYGSRTEITDACRALAHEVRREARHPDEITPADLAGHLYTADTPDPDFMIRTGGEMRLSNFLLWQLSYTELYFTDTLWPDFRKEQYLAALRVFAERERRFGDVKQQ